MGKKTNPALDAYTFTGEYPAGVCGTCGLEYNISTINADTIEAFIERGSPLFVKKKAKKAKEEAAAPSE
jgi:hypothetical protein